MPPSLHFFILFSILYSFLELSDTHFLSFPSLSFCLPGLPRRGDIGVDQSQLPKSVYRVTRHVKYKHEDIINLSVVSVVTYVVLRLGLYLPNRQVVNGWEHLHLHQLPLVTYISCHTCVFTFNSHQLCCPSSAPSLQSRAELSLLAYLTSLSVPRYVLSVIYTNSGYNPGFLPSWYFGPAWVMGWRSL